MILKKTQLAIMIIGAVQVTAFAQNPTDAQSNDNTENVYVSNNAQTRGFGSFIIKSSRVGDENTLELGGLGGGVWSRPNYDYFIGGGGVGQVGGANWGPNQKLNLGYGGFAMGLTYAPTSVAHFTTALLLGWGGVTVKNSATNTKETGGFGIAELSGQIETTISTHFQVGFGASYRFASNPDIDYVSSQDLSKPSLFFTFKFGQF